jgi:hypothetical protein
LVGEGALHGIGIRGGWSRNGVTAGTLTPMRLVRVEGRCKPW